MNFTEKYSKLFKYLLPAPFTIAVLLTIATFLIALFFTLPASQNLSSYSYNLLQYWEDGLWSSGLLVFALQMMLMLVLGHVLALTAPINNIISIAVNNCNNTAKAAFLVTFLTIIVSLFNWGLGLIFGAIFARKVAEYSLKNNINISYPLIGAAGYSGLMVWHGGLSGSSLAKVTEENHIKDMMVGIISPEKIDLLPTQISYWETVGSTMNITVMILLITIVPIFMYFIGKKSKTTPIQLKDFEKEKENTEMIIGAEKLDYSKLFSKLFGAIICFYILIKIYYEYDNNVLSFFNPNNINLLLFALAILLHKNFYSFLNATDEAISGASGILIQFPLYFGIMGIMKSSGLVNEISDFFVHISSESSYPLFTFLSAGIVNIFVPSGGGQWAVQGPIIIQAASEMGLSLPKSILALAYGDQLTNMLQPFWALPLLGITGLKAKEILPYTLALMIIGAIIYLSCLIIF